MVVCPSASLSQSLVTAGALQLAGWARQQAGQGVSLASATGASVSTSGEGWSDLQGPCLCPSANSVGAESTLGFLEGRAGLFAC